MWSKGSCITDFVVYVPVKFIKSLENTRELIEIFCGSCLKPLLHPNVHAKKLADLQETLKLQLRVYNKIYQGITDPTIKTCMHIFSACTQYGYKCIHILRVTETCAHAFSLIVLQDLPIHSQGLHLP